MAQWKMLLKYIVCFYMGIVVNRAFFSPRGSHCQNYPSAEFIRKMQTNLPENTIEQSTITSDGMRKNRILCWIPISPKFHWKAKLVKETWGKRCDKLLFLSSRRDKQLPDAIVLPMINDTYINLWGKIQESLKYLYDHHLDDADWFFKADTDTYAVMENMRHMLLSFDSSKPLLLGFHSKFMSNPNPTLHQTFVNGGGYVLTKEAIRRFVEIALVQMNSKNHTTKHGIVGSPCVSGPEGPEDINLGICLQSINVTVEDTRDIDGSNRFFPLHFLEMIYGDDSLYSDWAVYPMKQDLKCCSSHAVAFHYLKEMEMKLYEYLIYKLRLH